MFDIYCVTNRNLCRGNFLERMEKILQTPVRGIILREKDMDEKDYRRLAQKVLKLCKEQEKELIVHTYISTAKELGCTSFHAPLSVLRANAGLKEAFKKLGASVHSAAEAKEAQSLGCTYLTAGHIFETDCKKGLKPRGTAFLREVCGSVSIPVYAIGGIHPENIQRLYPLKNQNLKGFCIMSGWMQCEDPKTYLQQFYAEKTGRS